MFFSVELDIGALLATVISTTSFVVFEFGTVFVVLNGMDNVCLFFHICVYICILMFC